MRFAILLLAALSWTTSSAFAGSAALSDAAGHYAISAAGSDLAFSIGSVGGTGIHGRFTRFSGEIDINPANIARSRVAITIVPASVETGQSRVDAFLKSDAVFDVATQHAITFRSASVRRTGDRTATVEGALTARGHTRPATFEAELAGMGAGWISFHVRGKVFRSPYGMDVGTPIYSNVVQFDMRLKARQK